MKFYGEATYWHNHPDLPCLAQSVREQMELQVKSMDVVYDVVV